MLTKNQKIYHWRYGEMTVVGEDTDYIYANIDHPEGVVITQDAFDQYMLETRTWTYNGSTITAQKCFQISGFKHYYHDNIMDALLGNKELKSDRPQKMQPDVNVLPIKGEKVHKGIIEKYKKVLENIDIWDKKHIEFTLDKYPNQMSDEDINKAKQEAKGTFTDPDKYKKFCEDIDKIIIEMKKYDIEMIKKNKKKLKDPNYMINFTD